MLPRPVCKLYDEIVIDKFVNKHDVGWDTFVFPVPNVYGPSETVAGDVLNVGIDHQSVYFFISS